MASAVWAVAHHGANTLFIHHCFAARGATATPITTPACARGRIACGHRNRPRPRRALTYAYSSGPSESVYGSGANTMPRFSPRGCTPRSSTYSTANAPTTSSPPIARLAARLPCRRQRHRPPTPSASTMAPPVTSVPSHSRRVRSSVIARGKRGAQAYAASGAGAEGRRASGHTPWRAARNRCEPAHCCRLRR